MQIKRLKYFQEVVKEKSISKVAKKSHISQPALSKQMQKLEDTLGKMLFIRSNKGVELTQAGEIVSAYGENIIRTYNKMLYELNDQKSKECRIAAHPVIATYCLPCVILNMQIKYPKHKCDLVSASHDKIEQDVLNEVCEIGFSTKPSEVNLLNCKKIHTEKVVLISPSHYELAEKVKFKDIADLKFVMCNKNSVIKEKLEAAINNIGINFKNLDVLANLESIEAVKTLVGNGYGIGFVPYSSISDELRNKMIRISIVEDINLNYNIYLINKRQDYLTNELKGFINSITEIYKKQNK